MKRPTVIVLLASLALFRCSSSQEPFFKITTPEEYLNEMLDYMEANHIDRKSIDWPAFRQAVQQKGAGAETISGADGAVLLALELLNDQTSFLVTSQGKVLAFSTPCTDAAPPEVTVPADVGYIKIPAFGNSGVNAAVFAEKMHGDIRAQDKAGLKGWLVDLRGNTGGNMWPMVAGIGPILGEGTAGYFIDSNDVKNAFGYQDGASFYGEKPVVGVSFPYTLLSADSKVAILVDHATTNAAEAVAIAFIGKANARSFGPTTCGRAGGNQAFTLSDGSILYLTVSFLKDRAETAQRGELTPDEIVTDPILVFDKAVEWINQ
ncbi:MAG TPA: S41 family peptidase [Cyclobacteriaceae bacterium]|nr:S41 family peptidase [Cyclobacteriaceae bacterium]MCB9236903.1 S41 family peptidase [Flammeovirgaceae bacterium]MCB0498530.1 S41 family peptidase [Cyclobacteriaceae bacterium]MCO5271494.1 S41 family peptidase [Cyclobacteriaceae bacterium]MCW5901390.1 S41 family peptidase [Cyclobacteriaceae bacterium]